MALALLLIGPVLVLGRAELSPAEGRFAQSALGALEHDARGRDQDAPARDGAARLLRGWALIVGTTERPLRLLNVLAFLLAVLVAAEAAAATLGVGARPLVLLVGAAAPLLHRQDLLLPGAAAPLVGACALGALVFATTGARRWLLPGFLALGAAPFLGNVEVVVAVASFLVALVLAATEGRMGRALILLALLALVPLPGLWGHLREWTLPPISALPGDPSLVQGVSGLVLGAWILALIGAGLGFARRKEARSLPARWPVAALVLVAGGVVALLAQGGEPLHAMNAIALLPALALAMAGAALRGGRIPVVLSALGLVVAVALLLRQDLATRAGAPSVVRPVLAAARAAGRPGGRLIISGPLRHAILFYSRRGHDPGVPILCLPEDARAAELGPLLADRLGFAQGVHPEQLPPLLCWPPLDPNPEGLHRVDEIGLEGPESPLVRWQLDAALRIAR